jgi:5-formyltetrahydrofolate cyclo-ligase
VTPIEAEKSRLRETAKTIRAGCDPSLAEPLTTHVLRECPPPPGTIVAGYWPIGTEIDIRPLLHALHERGHDLCLPETGPRATPLIFRKWHPGAALLPGRFGTVHPEGEVCVPTYVLVPLLAFDASGNRLGYGGGYYDRTFAALPPETFRLGCAYAAQQVPTVPVSATDTQLHAIATEAQIFFIDKQS